MKVAIINFSGNVGKTTLSNQLLAPRLEAEQYSVETINAGASDQSIQTKRIRGKDFSGLQEDLMVMESAIVDIGASNAEDFIKTMGLFDGSHEEFDFFIVPVVPEKKQQLDAINTIKTLARLGVPAEKIRVVFNRVDPDDLKNLPSIFPTLFGFNSEEKLCVLNEQATVLNNEIFDRLRQLKKTISEVLNDDTDYRNLVRTTDDPEEKDFAIAMVSAKRLAKSANRNLDEVFETLFA